MDPTFCRFRHPGCTSFSSPNKTPGHLPGFLGFFSPLPQFSPHPQPPPPPHFLVWGKLPSFLRFFPKRTFPPPPFPTPPSQPPHFSGTLPKFLGSHHFRRPLPPLRFRPSASAPPLLRVFFWASAPPRRRSAPAAPPEASPRPRGARRELAGRREVAVCLMSPVNPRPPHKKNTHKRTKNRAPAGV